jgi:diguanylate cyclase (GGDEF)-like protein
MFVDLDGFKGINDRYGHAAGDVLLKAVARELIGHVRASDVVGRIGGDEFGIIIWRVEEPQASAKARQMEAMIARIGITHGRSQISVAASVGIAPLIEDSNPADVIAAADQAMYARKDERRGLPAAVSWGE